MGKLTKVNLKLLMWCSLALATLFLVRGFYIPVKAMLAQKLRSSAWSETLPTHHPVKPWPWADTFPVAHLSVPAHHISQIVLAGDHGNSLGFAPGLDPASDLGHSTCFILISGHRDTHFRFLKDVKPGETLTLQTSNGVTTRYRVEEIKIADNRHTFIRSPGNSKWLTLATCYPFDSIRSNPSLRYVVLAAAIGTQHNSVVPNNSI